MEENVIQITGGITINVAVSVKEVINVKKLYLESCYMYLPKLKLFSKDYE